MTTKKRVMCRSHADPSSGIPPGIRCSGPRGCRDAVPCLVSCGWCWMTKLHPAEAGSAELDHWQHAETSDGRQTSGSRRLVLAPRRGILWYVVKRSMMCAEVRIACAGYRAPSDVGIVWLRAGPCRGETAAFGICAGPQRRGESNGMGTGSSRRACRSLWWYERSSAYTRIAAAVAIASCNKCDGPCLTTIERDVLVTERLEWLSSRRYVSRRYEVSEGRFLAERFLA